MPENVTAQDPNAHLFYEVDWTEWLTRRSIPVEDIISMTFTITGAGVISQQSYTGAVGKVYVRDTVSGQKAKVTCHIEATNPDPGDPLEDDYTFTIVGGSS